VGQIPEELLRNLILSRVTALQAAIGELDDARNWARSRPDPLSRSCALVGFARGLAAAERGNVAEAAFW